MWTAATPAGLGRFFPGLLLGSCLGYALKWLVDRMASNKPGEEGPSSGQRRQLLTADERCRRAQLLSGHGEELKMVLVVNDSLKMGKGKIGAQCAHAAVGIVEQLVEEDEDLLLLWDEGGQPKVCLKASDTEELMALAAAAEGAGLPYYIVQDAGRTQIAAGSRTVVGIGPGSRARIDAITGHLKLL